MTLNQRVVERLKEEKEKRGLTMQDIADFIGWNRVKVVKKFGQATKLTLDEAEQICFAVGLPPTEAVRDRGLEFCADLTPTELRRLEQFRLLPRATAEAIDHLLRIHKSDLEQRGATPKRSIFGKARAK